MISRRTAAVLLGSATLGLVATATSPAAAHPGHGDKAQSSQQAEAGNENAHPAAARARARAQARRSARSFRRVLRNCTIAPDQLLTVDNSDRLKKIDERLDTKVAAEDLTQGQADKRFARAQKKVTIRTTMRTAQQAPIVSLFGVENWAAFRTAVKDAGGVRALIEATDDVERADFRDAKREGRTAARAAVTELCNTGADDSEESDDSENAL
jgi:hypothetical protein